MNEGYNEILEQIKEIDRLTKELAASIKATYKNNLMGTGTEKLIDAATVGCDYINASLNGVKIVLEVTNEVYEEKQKIEAE